MIKNAPYHSKSKEKTKEYLFSDLLSKEKKKKTHNIDLHSHSLMVTAHFLSAHIMQEVDQSLLCLMVLSV